MPRILNQSSGQVVLDISGNGSYTIPTTTLGSMVLVYTTYSETAPTLATTDGALSVQLFTMGPGGPSQPTVVGYRTASSSGLTAITIAGDADDIIDIIYIEYSGVASFNAVGAVGTWAANGSWTSGTASPATNGWSALMVAPIFSTSTTHFIGRLGYSVRLETNAIAPFMIGIQDTEIVSIGAGPFTATGFTSVGGANGALLIFRTYAPSDEFTNQRLWARSSL